MNGKKSRTLVYILVFILAALIIMAAFVALRLRYSHYEGASISTELSLIDSDIQLGNISHALASLKKIEKRASGLYDRIGIFKRYSVLGESKLAERCLVRALRRFPKNQELTALYGNYLLRHNRIGEALSKTESLLGTDYGSVYAEAFLRNALTLNYDADSLFAKKRSFFGFLTKKSKTLADDDFKHKLFTDSRFIPIYKEAAKSGTSIWLINAAAIMMHSGDYAQAADMYGPFTGMFIPSYHDALFWGLVFYDAGRHAESLSALKTADGLDASRDVASAIELRALESDNY